MRVHVNHDRCALGVEGHWLSEEEKAKVISLTQVPVGILLLTNSDHLWIFLESSFSKRGSPALPSESSPSAVSRLPAKGQIVSTMMSTLAWWVLHSAHLPNEALDYLISSCSDNSVLVTSAIDWNTREKMPVEPVPWHLLFKLRWVGCIHLANAWKLEVMQFLTLSGRKVQRHSHT